jgi:hypothetical protein
MEKYEYCVVSKVSKYPSSSVRVTKLDAPDEKVLDVEEGMGIVQVISLLESDGWDRVDRNVMPTSVYHEGMDAELITESYFFRRKIAK